MFLTRVQQLRIIQAALNLELDKDENHFAQALVLRQARRLTETFLCEDLAIKEARVWPVLTFNEGT